jgi:hypothetical protein
MRLRILAIGLVASLLFISAPQRTLVQAADTLPGAITDTAFWKMISDFSETGGGFAFEMFMSNEITFQNIIPDLMKQAPQGGVYLGVAPEQNFTYITVLRPRMAFIIDIRRENMIEMLMYKALFEMSPNRAEFISRLFSRKLPARASGPNPDPQSSVDRLFDAFTASRPDAQFFAQNVQSIKDRLQKTHGFPLSPPAPRVARAGRCWHCQSVRSSAGTDKDGVISAHASADGAPTVGKPGAGPEHPGLAAGPDSAVLSQRDRRWPHARRATGLLLAPAGH